MAQPYAIYACPTLGTLAENLFKKFKTFFKRCLVACSLSHGDQAKLQLSDWNRSFYTERNMKGKERKTKENKGTVTNL